MRKKELIEHYEKNVAWLKKNIPPDDIYDFSEQTLMSAIFFLKIYSEECDANERAAIDPVFAKWSKNIMGLTATRMEHEEVKIDLGLLVDDEENE